MNKLFTIDEYQNLNCTLELLLYPQVILAATEQFNLKPKQGITFLQERRVISGSDSPQYPAEVASFLVDNPWLDKAKIGEYIGDRKNPPILDAFVKWASSCLLLTEFLGL